MRYRGRVECWKTRYQILKARVHLCLSPEHRRVVRTARKGYSYSSGFIYDLEKVKLKEMLKDWERMPAYYEDRPYMLRDIRTCIWLIEIFNEEKHLDDIRINTQNALRFDKNIYLHFYENFPEELYKLKAKSLYHKIRLERDQDW